MIHSLKAFIPLLLGNGYCSMCPDAESARRLQQEAPLCSRETPTPTPEWPPAQESPTVTLSPHLPPFRQGPAFAIKVGFL